MGWQGSAVCAAAAVPVRCKACPGKSHAQAAMPAGRGSSFGPGHHAQGQAAATPWPPPKQRPGGAASNPARNPRTSTASTPCDGGDGWSQPAGAGSGDALRYLFSDAMARRSGTAWKARGFACASRNPSMGLRDATPGICPRQGGGQDPASPGYLEGCHRTLALRGAADPAGRRPSNVSRLSGPDRCRRMMRVGAHPGDRARHRVRLEPGMTAG